MSDLYLSRATLRRDVPSSALRYLLVPADDSARVAAGHRLIWTLFSDAPDRRRDFLWREAEPGHFYFLSHRPPEDRHGLFNLDPPKYFSPELRSGDRLAFVLRANATTSRILGEQKPADGKTRGKPCDVVMNALHTVPKIDRARLRQQVIRKAGLEWLTKQGEKAGFHIDTQRRSDGADEETPSMEYRTLRVSHGLRPAQLGILDFQGILRVQNPDTFVATVTKGFGRAKAFGCGLMLIRRV